jgi:hypothetical protein
MKPASGGVAMTSMTTAKPSSRRRGATGKARWKIINQDTKQHMTTTTTLFSGGCACGAIRYESTAEPAIMLHCHCRDCQRSSGGPFSSFVIVPTEAFKLLQGSLRFHDSPSHAGGKTHRGFCPDCGSPLVAKSDSAAQFAAIRAGSLDDPSWFNPQVDVWTSDAHPWHQMNPTLPKFQKYPE